MSGSEIVEEWRGTRVRVLLATEGHLEGEVMRADAVGVMLALEKLAPGGEVEFTAGEGSTRCSASYRGPRSRSWSRSPESFPSPIHRSA